MTDIARGKMEELLDLLPNAMAELMKDFIKNRDLTARAKIRLRMKALLDVVSADTEYPPIPDMKKDVAPDPNVDRQIARGLLGQSANPLQVPQTPFQPTVPIPGITDLPRENSFLTRS